MRVAERSLPVARRKKKKAVLVVVVLPPPLLIFCAVAGLLCVFPGTAMVRRPWGAAVLRRPGGRWRGGSAGRCALLGWRADSPGQAAGAWRRSRTFFGSRSQLGSNKLFWLKPFWLKETLLAQASPFGPNKPFLAQTLLAQTFFGSNPFGSNPLLLKQTPLPYILQLYAPPCRDRQGRRPRHYDRFQKQFSKTA